MRSLRIVTTSWDDGDPHDSRIADALRRRGVSGTFYIPLTGYRGRPTLARNEIRALSQASFEVGAHGVSHRNLPGLPTKEIGYEVRACKHELEDITSGSVDMFCYPRGRYDREVICAVREAGYVGARTTRMLAHVFNFRPFQMPTGLQVYPHARSTYMKNVCRTGSVLNVFNCATHLRSAGNWVELGRELFDVVLRQGGVWHLFGHSWEINDLDLWTDLEEMLDYVCGRPGVTYLSNGDVVKALLLKAS